MLFKYIYLIKGDFKDILEIDDEHPIEVIIPVSQADFFANPETFRMLYDIPGSFCFLVSEPLLENFIGDQHQNPAREMLRFLFLQNYRRQSGKTVLFVQSPTKMDHEEFDEALANMTSSFAKQGVKNIVIEMVAGENEPAGSARGKLSVSYMEMNKFLPEESIVVDMKAFSEKVLSVSLLTKKWLITIESAKDLKAKLELVRHFEGWLRNHDPMLVKMIDIAEEAASERDSLLLDNQLLKEKLDNSSSYLKLLKDNAQWYVNDHSRLTLELQRVASNSTPVHIPPPMPAPDNSPHWLQLQQQIAVERSRGDSILEWYKKEYEVLPGWYKKMGHLIKAATGKRTVKSLFK